MPTSIQAKNTISMPSDKQSSQPKMRLEFIVNDNSRSPNEVKTEQHSNGSTRKESSEASSSMLRHGSSQVFCQLCGLMYSNRGNLGKHVSGKDRYSRCSPDN